MNAIIETSLYYEDLIEEYVNDPQKDESETKLFSEALRTGKQEWYNRAIKMSSRPKRTSQNDFRKSMEVVPNTKPKSVDNNTYRRGIDDMTK